jgi:hypothetical protein
MKMPTTLKNLKLMAYELIEGYVTKRRLATFHNSGKKSNRISNKIN